MKLALTFVLGSSFTTVIYVLAGIISPSGFHNLRDMDATHIAIIGALVWFWSTIFTVAIAGSCWAILHRRELDGFLVYTLIAVVGCMAISLVISGDMPDLLMISMAIANAIGVRIFEFLLLNL
jgi:hypothetical protein